MVTVFAPVDEIGADEFKRVTEVTYLGGVYGAMAALKRMRTRDRGTIVQVSSALAYRSIPLQSAYCGAKHAAVFLGAQQAAALPSAGAADLPAGSGSRCDSLCSEPPPPQRAGGRTDLARRMGPTLRAGVARQIPRTHRLGRAADARA